MVAADPHVMAVAEVRYVSTEVARIEVGLCVGDPPSAVDPFSRPRMSNRHELTIQRQRSKNTFLLSALWHEVAGKELPSKQRSLQKVKPTNKPTGEKELPYYVVEQVMASKLLHRRGRERQTTVQKLQQRLVGESRYCAQRDGPPR